MITDTITSQHPLSPEWVLNILSTHCTAFHQQTPCTVAFSGGVDSTVLLHLLTVLRDQGQVSDLRAVHVHHGLSRFADGWAEHCQRLCKQWSVPLSITRVSLNPDGHGLEQAARDARYPVFAAALRGGGCLLQGHHQNDQAETILLRLFRGTGVDGFAGIPEQRPLGDGVLLRPLLTVSRAAIETYAHENQLPFIDDDSNTDVRFSRNFLRQQLLPLIEARWPGAAGRMTAFANEVAQMNQQVQQQVEGLLNFDVDHQSLPSKQLSLELLKPLDGAAQQRVVRHWLKALSVPLPSRQLLALIFKEVVAARIDAQPQLRLSEHCIITRYQHRLAVVDTRMAWQSPAPLVWDWQKAPVLPLGPRSLAMVRGQGEVQLPAKPLLLKWRCHIDCHEKIAVSGRRGRKVLKKWLQEYQVPPWLRDSLPFVYDDDQMVAAPGFWVCSGYRSHGGATLIWQ